MEHFQDGHMAHTSCEEPVIAELKGSRILCFMRSLVVSLVATLCATTAAHSDNLVPDASFESPVARWFQEHGGWSYYAGKEKVEGAPDGDHVLAIQGWDARGSRILAPTMDLGAETYCGALSVRGFGTLDGVTVEYGLFDEKGQKPVASFGKVSLSQPGRWLRIEKANVSPSAPAAKGRLCIVVSGPHEGARVEVDLAGLFAGGRIGPIDDNAFFRWFEAETLANGEGWREAGHYRSWYAGQPSGGKMLAGYYGHSKEYKQEVWWTVSRTVAIPRSRRYRLFVRFVIVNEPNANTFTISLEQNGRPVASKEINDGRDKHGGGRLRWVWESIEADLDPGAAKIVLSRSKKGGSWVCRKIDLLALTSLVSYEPNIQDFRPKGYMRWTNLSEGQEPFCMWVWIRRHQAPNYFANVGMLTAAGASRSYYVPRDESKWLAPGERTPWIRISDDLLPGGGRNNVSLHASRKQHTAGFVQGRIRGRLEFALGTGHEPLRTIDFDQEAYRVLLTLPANFDTDRDMIRWPYDYIEEKEKLLAEIPEPRRKRAKHLELSTQLAFTVGRDDPNVIEREINIIKKLGFNTLYHNIAPPESAFEFYRAHDLKPIFGHGVRDLWLRARKEKSMHHPEAAMIDARLKQLRETVEPIIPNLNRIDLMDEPGGMSYEAIVGSELCRKKFAESLKAEGLRPADLGVSGWAEVVPVGPEKSAEHPMLFYHTGIFRLQAFATFVRAVTEAKNRHFPKDAGLTYVNYSPPYGGGSWTLRGTDLFFTHRDGGLELGWTEDWKGYGAGPQHLSDTLALLRAASAHRQPIGCYCIPAADLTMLRMQYYTLLAGGARTIVSYNYGPWYASIDSWGRNFDVYRSLAVVQHELGTIDEALADTTRRPVQAAILYNRTASIWEKQDYTTLQNGSYIHWALAHAGYDADFLAEEDIEDGRLAKYKVFYLHGSQLRRKTAKAIAEWVRSDGILFGSMGAGCRDEYDRPLDTLVEVFRSESIDGKLERNVGRPKYELRSQPILDVLNTTDRFDGPAVEFNQLCYREAVEPLDGGKVILRNKSGESAGTIAEFGRGKAIRVAGTPGITYLNDAVRVKEYDPNSYMPKAFRRELRDFIAWPARLASVEPMAKHEAPCTEIIRYDAPDRAVVFLIDHRAQPIDRFTFELMDATGFRSAFSASGAHVDLADKGNGTLEVTLSMNAADAVVLTR